MPKRLHAMKIYYRARGCWSNNRSHSGEERTERGEEKKARIFRLEKIENLLKLVFFREGNLANRESIDPHLDTRNFRKI